MATELLATLRRMLFPDRSRRFPGWRWLHLALRSLHLIGLGGLGGAYVYALPESEWLAFFWLTVLTGLIMMLLQVWANAIWLLQVRGLAIVVKLALLLGMSLAGSHSLTLFVVIILISGVVAHAPADLRYYSVWHRGQVKSLGGGSGGGH